MKIVIVAGGTGGHIYPALTLANSLKEKGHDILFVGSNSRMEKDIIPSNGYDFIGLDVTIPKGNIFNKFISLLTLLKAYFKCKKIVEGYDFAIGFGNYISLPVILAAKSKGLKTMIHEQNSFAGKANLYLDLKVDYVIGSYDENLKQFKNNNTYIYGNPQTYKALNEKEDKSIIEKYGLSLDKKTVLIFMGSLGSSSVNDILCDYFKLTDGSYQILYACGKDNYECLKDISFGEHIKVVLSIDGTKAIKNCDLIISRAGATTLSELIACGKPSILIPSPFVPENHQFYNASSLSDVNGAILIEEKDLNASSLNDAVSSIINNDISLKEMGNNAYSLLKEDTLENMIRLIEK